ncbi:sugar phosphate isomerase/epimerase family protein [Paenibacillus koleovorans]|uniref:sugar phosphate isomerase/epimerase family protein n=1 Tax=Paenibacillus koleovorans TaxID=121608 RepID=UPI000FD9F26B|nr:sugar phosphate isomerase/epimerase [Paenibacillus koleovorans]
MTDSTTAKIKLACMTLPYMKYPLERALQGISEAGYRYIAFGLPHAGAEAPDEQDPEAVHTLRRLFDRYGVEPVMLVSTNQLAPGQPIERAQKRFETAKALGIPELLCLGVWGYRAFPHEPLPADELQQLNAAFIEKYREVAKLAEQYNIVVTLKPHTGNTATAAIIAETIAAIGSPYVRVCYDPGNVHFYEGIDPAKDMELLPVSQITSFIAKDHQGERAENRFPIPGRGDVNFPSMLGQLIRGGFEGPVVVERLDGPVPGEQPTPEQIDGLIREAREELESLIAAAQST